MVAVRNLLVLAVAQLSQLQLANAFTGQQIASGLHRNLSPESEIVLATDPAFVKDFTQRFSAGGTANYSVGVKPATVKDVQKAVSTKYTLL